MLSLTRTRLKWSLISLYKEKHAEALKVVSRPVLVRHSHVLFTGMEKELPPIVSGGPMPARDEIVARPADAGRDHDQAEHVGKPGMSSPSP